MSDDVLGDLGIDLDAEPSDDDDVESGGTVTELPVGGDALVCDYVDENGVCGETFTGKNAPMMRGLHRKKEHGIQGADAARRKTPKAQTGGKAPRKATGKKPPAQPKLPPVTNRAAIYTSSLSMAALAAYLALPPFDQYDLDVCNAGAPRIGSALGSLADHNASVARAADLILAGGGGDYLAVIMAVVPVVGAIFAHHGALPNSSGERFAAMIGMTPPPAPAESSSAAPTSGPVEAVAPKTADDVIAFFAGVEESVLTDAMTKMMSMGGAIPVAVPFDMTVNPDGHVGSEQMKPTEPMPMTWAQREAEGAAEEQAATV